MKTKTFEELRIDDIRTNIGTAISILTSYFDANNEDVQELYTYLNNAYDLCNLDK